jgi:hypothetical protein
MTAPKEKTKKLRLKPLSQQAPFLETSILSLLLT